MPAGTVYVGRPTVFGNPWVLKDTIDSGLFVESECAEVCVRCYRSWLSDGLVKYDQFPLYAKLRPQLESLLLSLPSLRGKDLACWCPIGSPCHADVLLDLANRPI